MIATRTLCAAFVLTALSACTIHRGDPASDDHMAHMSSADMASSEIMASGSMGTAGLPPSANSAPARLAASPRHAEWVKIAWEPGSPDSLMAWIVYPSTTREHTPVVVVVHEIFGLQTWVRGVADQVAAEGFIAIAPDIISRVRGGPSTEELKGDSAVKLIRGVDAAERNRGIRAAANYAMSQPSAAPKFDVIGYCWGGSATWGAAVSNAPGFSGGVAFYGTPYMTPAVPGGAPAAPNADSLRKIMAPVMLLSGTKDPRIGAAMPSIASTMKALGKSYYGKNYDGAVHGFLRAQDDLKAATAQCDEACVARERADNLAATKDGWPRTVAFLKRSLGI